MSGNGGYWHGSVDDEYGGVNCSDKWIFVKRTIEVTFVQKGGLGTLQPVYGKVTDVTYCR
jgi:hypothetical protein